MSVVVYINILNYLLPDPLLLEDMPFFAVVLLRPPLLIDEAFFGAAFFIADLLNRNIWALFVRPENESMGIGKKLHGLMLDWYFGQTNHTVWLSTSPGTRAEQFYRQAGWMQTGMHGKEIKFEMSKNTWLNDKNTNPQSS